MYGILKSIGIDYLSNEYIQIIQDCFNSIHFDNEHLNEEEIETDLLIHNDAELVVENLLFLHQQRLVMRQNLPDEYDFTTNTDVMDSSYDNEMFCNFNGRYSFFDLINHWIHLKPILWILLKL